MRTGGFDMRGSVEAVAVARDVASSTSPSKNASALDMIRYQRITPDCLPLANGSGSSSSASRKLPALAPRSSTDVHDAPDAASDASRLASYLASASLEQHKPRARALLPTPAPSSAGVVIRSPARDHGLQPTSDFANHTIKNANVGSGSGSAAPDGSVPLQWGHTKRSRGRRDAPPLLPTPIHPPLLPTPVRETPAQARRRASMKLQRRAAASSASASAQVPAEKLMPPPSNRGGVVFRSTSSLPPRAAAVAAMEALHGRTTAILQQHRSAEEPRAGAGADPQQQQQPHHPSRQQQRPQRQASEKEKGKAPASPERPRQQPAELQKLAVAAALPRIFTTLSRKEKEEDFLAMKGTKLPVRPKKRTKAVEKAVSLICPGQYLGDLTKVRYMVREKKSKKEKRGGGLKAMDSDSD